jgi:LDH2 family malate/lactate/ureidoglycolate dehydrogenase
MTEPDQIPAARLRESVAELFAAAGLSKRAAETVASALVDADLRGVHSHGVNLVPVYLERLRNGTVSTQEHARVVSDKGATALLDGGHSLGILTGDEAMNLAIAKAKDHGVGVVVVRHAFHFGAAFRYVQAAARAGHIGVAASNTRPLMPAPGGAKPVVGNNPVAIGVPRGSGEPLVLDMALSQAAQGKIRLAAKAGRQIPDNWATDEEGRPTTDAQAALAGMLLPIGLHKGFGLALMVDILTGVLSGGGFGASVHSVYNDMTVPNDCAHLFLALDVSAFIVADDFMRRVAQLAEAVTRGGSIGDTDRLVLPGQLEDERFETSLVDGIALDPAVAEALRECASALAAPPTPGTEVPT